MTTMFLPSRVSLPLGLSRAVAVLFLVLAVGACSSSGKVDVKKAKYASIPQGKSVALLVKTAIGDESKAAVKEKADAAARRVRSALFGRLVTDAVFKSVRQPGEAADYRMVVVLRGTRKVSGAARFWLGAFAGSNSLNMSVTLHEAGSGKLLAEFDVAGRSASHPFSSRAGYDDAVREAVTLIIDALR